MVLKESSHDAKDVKEGVVIQHTLSVFNDGDQPLLVQDVNSDWGCISAEFDRAVPPGGEGKIRLRVTTEGYEGPVEKTARIYSNDPARKETFYKITANVKVPIHLSTYYVLLSGAQNQPVTKSVDIRAELDNPLILTPLAFNLEEKLAYVVEEVEKGKKFQVRFTSIPGPAKSYQGYLKIQTNYPEKPELTIRIRGRFGASS